MASVENSAVASAPGDLTIDEVMPSDPKSLENQSAVNSDDLELIRMGKKPKMKRVYNFWTCKL